MALLGYGQRPDFFELLDPEVQWDVTEAPDAGETIRGREAVRRFLFTWRYGWEHWRFEEDGFFDAGGRVVTVLADESGACVWTFEGGRVTHFRWHTDAANALASVWPRNS
jgi:ketosteroid isomerase-like protein